jgi:hypothetical protein
MKHVHDIAGVAITLLVRSEQVLFVLLASDGTVNRMGTGSAQCTERHLFIGRTSQPLLPSLLANLTDEMLRFTGGYDVPNQQGDSCRLSIALKFTDGTEDGFGFAYGSRSQGPPTEISAFVRAAVSITDPWYSQQKAMVSNAPSTLSKPWWRFW